MKIQFRVAARSQPPPVDFDKLWHPIEPHGCAPENIELITLDQFLKLRVFESRSIAITVKDVILAAAHSDGGVHYGPPRKIEEALLIELDHSTMHMGQAASRQLLKSICRLTVASTLPLATRIQNSF
jgi:hypothetical protein